MHHGLLLLGAGSLGCYLSGRLTPTQPSLVTSREPDAALTEMTVMPGGGDLPVGTEIQPTLLMIHANDQVLARYAARNTFSVHSSNPAVIDVSGPGYWRTVGPGSATVTTRFHDMNSISDFSVYTPTNELPVEPPPLDTDGDGAPDILEEAFGSDPGVPDPLPQPRVILGSFEGQTVPLREVPVFTDGRDEGNGVYAAGGFFYIIEISHDLRIWRPADSSVVYLPPASHGPNRDLVRALIGSSSTRFLRVLVLKNE